MKRDVTLELLLPHPPAKVWRALTDQTLLSAWFMPTATFAPVLGHEFEFRMQPQRGWDGVTHCQIIDLVPEKTLAFTYRGEATAEKTLRCAGVESEPVVARGKGIFTRLDTVLRFTLTPDPSCSGEETTRLRLEHTGYRGFGQVLVSLVMGYGWKKSVLPRLAKLLAER
jgi:uncharacterized protein YndB with AHSA1/START domain